MGILRDAARPGRGNGGEGQSLRTAGGTSKTLAQGFQAGLPSHLFGEIRGLQPSGAPAGAAHVDEPAPATFVAESLDVIEASHSGKRSARSDRTSKQIGWSLYATRPCYWGSPKI
jgi:hypothetical protein